MACNTISTFALNCTPTIGGIKKVEVKEHGSVNWIADDVHLKDNAAYTGDEISAGSLQAGVVYYKAANTVAVLDVDYGLGVFVEVGIIPDNATFNTVMTYDKTKNVRYWTTDLSISVGEYSKTANSVQGSKEFVESMAKHHGIDVKITLNDVRESGGSTQQKTVTIENMFVQTATWNDGPTKADAGIGTVALQAVNKEAPEINYV